MDKEELTPLLEEIKRVLNDKIDEETLKSELDKYLNEYHVDKEAARRGILRKYGAIDSSAVLSGTVLKKIDTLTGNEQNADIIGKIVSSERRAAGQNGRIVISGVLGDETGTVQFTVWEPGDSELPPGSVFAFRNCYCRTWNGTIQVNVGSRGRIEPMESDISVKETAASVPAEKKKIGYLRGSEQNAEITARVMESERRTVFSRGENKEIISGVLGDETGTVPFTIWNSSGIDLETGSVYDFAGCYCKIWRDQIQLNLGNNGTVSPSSENIEVSGYTPSPKISAPGEKKKISELTGKENSVDLEVKILASDIRTVNIRGAPKDIISGIAGDETGTVPFTIWETEGLKIEKGSAYTFRNCYCKVWNDTIQINMNRGTAEPLDRNIDVSDRTFIANPAECKVKDIREGIGSISVRASVISCEKREVEIKGETRTVWSGMLADETGKIQFSAWKDFGIKERDSLLIENAYVRSWRGIPQLNLGERCAVSAIDSDFEIPADDGTPRTVADILMNGGGVDITISGTIVDIRAGSGLIKRCPECRRSVLGGMCQIHGQVEGVSDLRLKAVIDDSTGAIGAVIGRQDTEKLAGITLSETEALASRLGESAALAEIASKALMRKVRASGNVIVDDFGPSITVRSLETLKTDTKAEARKLLSEVEANLS